MASSTEILNRAFDEGNNRLNVSGGGRSLSFYAASDRVDIPASAAQNTSTFTYACWVCPLGSATKTMKGNASTAGPQFRILSGKLNLLKQTTADIGSSTTTVQNGIWQHCAVSYDGTTGAFVFYLNGIADGSGTNLQTFGFANNQLGSQSTSAEPMLGFMAQFVMCNAVLTAQQVWDLYSAGTIPASATGVYQLGEPSGTTAYDSSSSANNGTITGAVSSDRSPF